MDGCRKPRLFSIYISVNVPRPNRGVCVSKAGVLMGPWKLWSTLNIHNIAGTFRGWLVHCRH